jgi:hypothetical protein
VVALVLVIIMIGCASGNGDYGDEKTFIQCFIWHDECVMYHINCDLYIKFCPFHKTAVPPV